MNSAVLIYKRTFGKSFADTGPVPRRTRVTCDRRRKLAADGVTFGGVVEADDGGVDNSSVSLTFDFVDLIRSSSFDATG